MTREFVCATCKAFCTEYRWKPRKKYYCSFECYKKRPKIHTTPIQGQFTCANCGVNFFAKRWTTHEQYYCSSHCYKTRPPINYAKTCAHCGNDFYRRSDETMQAYRLRKNCSRECFLARQPIVNRKRVLITCDHCGKDFERRPCELNRSKKRYCSSKCQQTDINGARRRPLKDCVCLFCKTKFKLRPDHPGLYCSLACYQKDVSSKVESTCSNCGKTYLVHGYRLKNPRYTYCSIACKHDHFVGELTPNWLGGVSFEPYPAGFNSVIKRKVRERDGFCCVICSKTEEENNSALSIHHINYSKDDVTPQNLVSLCKVCHGKTNHNREKWKTLLAKRVLSCSRK